MDRSNSMTITQVYEARALPEAPLAMTGPHVSGWGIVGTAMLLPEVFVLMAGPPGCLRHPCFAMHERMQSERFYALAFRETDMVMGIHLEKVKDVAKSIVNTHRPRMLAICTTCSDYILGSDYLEIEMEIERDTGVKTVIVQMNPICTDLKPPPLIQTYGSLVKHLERREKVKGSIGLLGTFSPFLPRSELIQLLQDSGVNRIYQLAGCHQLDQIDQITATELIFLMHHRGRLAADILRDRYGIPYHFIETGYAFSTAEEGYRRMEEVLGISMPRTERQMSAENLVGSLSQEIADRKTTIAVGSGLNGSPFEVTRAFVEQGIAVKSIFAEEINGHDIEHIACLSERQPRIQVFRVSHPSLGEDFSVWNDIDLAIGLDAGYFCTKAKTVTLPYYFQGFGYENAVFLFREIGRVLFEGSDIHRLLYSSGLIS